MKKRKIILFSMITLIMIIFITVGCENEYGVIKEDTYSTSNIIITLEDGMSEKELENYTLYFEGNKAILTALKETFTDLEAIGLNEESTLQDYINAVLLSNEADYEVKQDEDIYYFTYDTTIDGTTFFYLSTVLKSDDAFWLFNFACVNTDKKQYEPKFIEWAKSIQIK